MKIIGTKEYQEIKSELQRCRSEISYLRSQIYDLKHDLESFRRQGSTSQVNQQYGRDIMFLRSRMEDMWLAIRNTQDYVMSKTIFLQDIDMSIDEIYGRL